MSIANGCALTGGLLALTLLGCSADRSAWSAHRDHVDLGDHLEQTSDLSDAPDLPDLASADFADSSTDLGVLPGAADGGADLGAIDATVLDGGSQPLPCEGITVETLAGSGMAGYLDGAGGVAQFYEPLGLAVDGAGILYVADSDNNRIRKVQPDGTTSTLAGNGLLGFTDGSGGPNGTASFRYLEGIAVDSGGTLFVADLNRVRKVAADGTTTTLAGNGTAGFFDGTGGPSGTTELNGVYGLAVDSLGFVYVSESTGCRIRKIAADGSTTTLTGNGTRGFLDGTGGPAGSTELNSPAGMAFDPQTGNLMVGDSQNSRIRLVTPNGNTTTLAGNLNFPGNVARDDDGNVYVSDAGSHLIRRVAPDGSTVTIAGGAWGFNDGPACTAQFSDPQGIALFGKLLYVVDRNNFRIRVIHLP